MAPSLKLVSALLLLGSAAVPAAPRLNKGLPSNQKILANGLKIWRKPGAIQGGAACATCHSPDGIELAKYAFDDADLIRRARPHLGAQDSKTLVAYFHALRSSLKIRVQLDPDKARPLQPGGSVLPGATPAERDLAFGKELATKLPLLFNGRVLTIDQAKAAEAQLLRLEPTNLRVGIPFNRLSEDIAHGNEHSSIAQWFPEIPPAIAPEHLAEWYAAEDKYLSNPSQANLHNLLLLHSQLVDTSRMFGFGAMSAVKFRALLVLQDRERHHTERLPLSLTPDVAAYGNFNPIWQVGDAARDVMDRNPGELGMGPDQEAKKLAGPSLRDQLHSMRVAWFWAGWLSDQGLAKTSRDPKTFLGMWLSESLSKDGPYPIHNIFANARAQAIVSNRVASWGETPQRRHRFWDFSGLRSFHFYERDIPKSGVHRKLYLAFTANCFRMNLLLLLDDISRTKEVWARRNTTAAVRELCAFISRVDPPRAGETKKLQDSLAAAVAAAKERL